MKNNFDLMETHETAKNSLGGTELMMRRIYDGKVSRELLEQVQIIPTRVTYLNPDKYRILYLHDLPGDPAVDYLKNDGWKKFHRIVFVSNWQQQAFINHYQIPWSRCSVMLNSIDPIPTAPKNNFTFGDSDTIKMVYHTTPHRGLHLLLPVFDKLCEKYNNLELHLYSSFKLYGWGERDEQFKNLFDFADNHPKIFNRGSVPNEDIREFLPGYDIFAYPSVWQETSCLSLMEAMSAGLTCVHPNFGALYETAANWTMMYNWVEDQNLHATVFYHVLDGVLSSLKEDSHTTRLLSQKSYADIFYNWTTRANMWNAFLQSVVNSGEPRGLPNEEFVYRIA